jgi:hypothetical protein
MDIIKSSNPYRTIKFDVVQYFTMLPPFYFLSHPVFLEHHFFDG